MAANHREYRVYPVNAQYLMDELHTPRFLGEMKISWLRDNVPGMQFTYTRKASFTSWGENITICLVPMDPYQTRVDVMSECSLPTQIIDWGTNKDNVYKIFRHLETYVVQPLQYGYQQNGGYPHP